MNRKDRIVLENSEIAAQPGLRLIFQAGGDASSYWLEGQVIRVEGSKDGNSKTGTIAAKVSIKALGDNVGGIVQVSDKDAHAAFVVALTAMIAAAVGFISSSRGHRVAAQLLLTSFEFNNYPRWQMHLSF